MLSESEKSDGEHRGGAKEFVFVQASLSELQGRPFSSNLQASPPSKAGLLAGPRSRNPGDERPSKRQKATRSGHGEAARKRKSAVSRKVGQTDTGRPQLSPSQYHPPSPSLTSRESTDSATCQPQSKSVHSGRESDIITGVGVSDRSTADQARSNTKRAPQEDDPARHPTTVIRESGEDMGRVDDFQRCGPLGTTADKLSAPSSLESSILSLLDVSIAFADRDTHPAGSLALTSFRKQLTTIMSTHPAAPNAKYSALRKEFESVAHIVSGLGPGIVTDSHGYCVIDKVALHNQINRMRSFTWRLPTYSAPDTFQTYEQESRAGGWNPDGKKFENGDVVGLEWEKTTQGQYRTVLKSKIKDVDNPALVETKGDGQGGKPRSSEKASPPMRISHLCG